MSGSKHIPIGVVLASRVISLGEWLQGDYFYRRPRGRIHVMSRMSLPDPRWYPECWQFPGILDDDNIELLTRAETTEVCKNCLAVVLSPRRGTWLETAAALAAIEDGGS